MPSLDNSFIRAIIESVEAIADGRLDPDAGTAAMRSAFLCQNSETPDNLASISRVRLGTLDDVNGANATCLMFAEANLNLAQVFWTAVETDSVAKLVQQRYPALRVEDIDAMLRICTVLLMNLEARRPRENLD